MNAGETLPFVRDGNGQNEYFYRSLNISEDASETEDENEETKLRKISISLSLYANILITVIKSISYIRTSSLSVLAALVDSILDVASQAILAYAEYQSNRIQR